MYVQVKFHLKGHGKYLAREMETSYYTIRPAAPQKQEGRGRSNTLSRALLS
jgi:hypothetical protein